MSLWDFLHAHMGFTWASFGCFWLVTILALDSDVSFVAKRRPRQEDKSQ